jgi:hypothetical protein
MSSEEPNREPEPEPAEPECDATPLADESVTVPLNAAVVANVLAGSPSEKQDNSPT